MNVYLNRHLLIPPGSTANTEGPVSCGNWLGGGGETAVAAVLQLLEAAPAEIAGDTDHIVKDRMDTIKTLLSDGLLYRMIDRE